MLSVITTPSKDIERQLTDRRFRRVGLNLHKVPELSTLLVEARRLQPHLAIVEGSGPSEIDWCRRI